MGNTADACFPKKSHLTQRVWGRTRTAPSTSVRLRCRWWQRAKSNWSPASFHIGATTSQGLLGGRFYGMFWRCPGYTGLSLVLLLWLASLRQDTLKSLYAPITSCAQHYGYKGAIQGGLRILHGTTLWALLESLHRIDVLLAYQKLTTAHTRPLGSLDLGSYVQPKPTQPHHQER